MDQLRVLASISEEATFGSQVRIIHEGERGDTLFVIIEGEVAVQRQSEGYGDASITRLATVGRASISQRCRSSIMNRTARMQLL